MRKVIFDTDIGSDIDDAIALAYLLSHPDCELIGVTTVTGDVRKRAEIVHLICREYGVDVPIFEGIGPAMGSGPGQPNVPHWEAIKDRVEGYSPRSEHAVDWIRAMIDRYPGEIDLLTVGPLTNIAALIKQDTSILRRTRQVVSMMGKFLEPNFAEWNCKCDPIANEIVLRESWNHTLIGLDVTMPCSMSPDEFRIAFADGAKSVILPMAETWLASAADVTFHDPLAAAVLFKPELCRYQASSVQGGAEGVTIAVPNPAGSHNVAVAVEPDAFFKEFFAVTR